MSPEEKQRHHQFLRSYAAQEPAIRAFVRRLVPSRSDADDVMQEVCVVLWEKFDQFRAGGDFRAWAFGVARLEVLVWRRDHARDRLLLDEDVVNQLADESSAIEPRLAQRREALEQCMEKVAPRQRGLLMAAYEPGSRIREVARHSGRTIPGFYQWLHRMRQRLSDCIRQALTVEDCP